MGNGNDGIRPKHGVGSDLGIPGMASDASVLEPVVEAQSVFIPHEVKQDDAVPILHGVGDSALRTALGGFGVNTEGMTSGQLYGAAAAILSSAPMMVREAFSEQLHGSTFV